MSEIKLKDQRMHITKQAAVSIILLVITWITSKKTSDLGRENLVPQFQLTIDKAT